MYDVVVIGAGIVGSFISWKLSRYEIKIAVVDKENDISNGTSMANSAIIHSGYDPEPNTLKAKLNVRGNDLYEEICINHNIPFERIGSLTVATSKDEMKILEELYNRGIENNVNVELIDKDKLHTIEPNLQHSAIKALFAPSCGIIYPWECALKLMEEACQNDVDLFLNNEVLDISINNDSFIVKTNENEILAKVIINASGTHAEEIYKMVNKNPEFHILPRRGQYYVLDKAVNGLVNHVIFPVPNKKSKGVLIIPTVHKNVMIGPTANDTFDLDDTDTSYDDFKYIRENASKLIADIPFNKVIRSFSGLRARADSEDFIIEESNVVSNFYNVAGIDSPGLASAPAIAEYLVDILLKKYHWGMKKEYLKSIPHDIKLHNLSQSERNELINKKPSYGNIVCRCENISEGEVVDAIHSIIPATSVKAIKKRCRPGMGRCQGGFCEPKIINILARELKVNILEVNYDNEKSKILLEETKDNNSLGGVDDGEL